MVQAHPPPDPYRQRQHLPIGGAEFVVVEPTADTQVQLADDGLDLVPAVAAGDFPDPPLEAVLRLVRPCQFCLVVQPVAEEPALLQRHGAAFGAVDGQSQASFAVSGQ